MQRSVFNAQLPQFSRTSQRGLPGNDTVEELSHVSRPYRNDFAPFPLLDERI